MKMKRYYYGPIRMMQDEYGEFVRWNDVKKLLERIKTLEAAIEHVLADDSDPKTVAEFGGYTLDDDTRNLLIMAMGRNP